LSWCDVWRWEHPGTLIGRSQAHEERPREGQPQWAHIAPESQQWTRTPYTPCRLSPGCRTGCSAQNAPLYCRQLVQALSGQHTVSSVLPSERPCGSERMETVPGEVHHSLHNLHARVIAPLSLASPPSLYSSCA